MKIADRYFQVDPWKIIEYGFEPSHGRASESVFSLANEFMGVRGYFEEGYSGDSLFGSYINGIYKKNIGQHFWCKGLAFSECFIINSVDWLYLRIFLDGEQLDLAKCKYHSFKRVLDMKSGTLSREFIWETSEGKLLKLTFVRFTSMDINNMGCQRITFEPINFDATIEVQSCLDFSAYHELTKRNYWTSLRKEIKNSFAANHALAADSDQQVFSAFKLKLPLALETRPIEQEKLVGQEFSLPLIKGKAVAIDKIVVNYAEKKGGSVSSEVWEKGMGLAEKYLNLSFDEALEEHSKHWINIWNKMDITIEGDNENQQGIRFCLFNLHQTYQGIDNTLNIGLKGLTGEVGGGRAWWVTEAFCLPFYLFNNPKAARNLLEYRYEHLPQALEHAKEVDCIGACYPMSTIDGTESYLWWEHSLLEIHVSAAIPYGIRQYAHLYNDKEFLYTKGIEILLQSSRYFASRGQWSQLTDEFGFYGVMGADEFHMMVHNNCYTNIMAKKTFEFTLNLIDEMKEKAVKELDKVFTKVGISQSELEDWKTMSEKMRILLDKKTGIYEQNDYFFDFPHIDVNTIPNAQLPVENHWAYDRIYRYDMIRQSDVLLFLLFFSQEFSLETKRANYEYYEPRCLHESVFSAVIHSILASELGKHQKAYEYAQFSSRLDLDNCNQNTADGLHITAYAGAWLNLVYGFGGMRPDGEKLVFNPSIPQNWTSYSFNIFYHGTYLNILINRQMVILKACSGPDVSVIVFGKEYVVDAKGMEIELPEERLG